MNLDALKAFALSIRSLSMDGVQAANSGHPGLPLGCADLGALLYGEILKHNPRDTSWINRDRFVLSAGHGSMLLYSLLHLTGYDLALDELKKFRQVGSQTPGHPEYGYTAGVETTTGPLGQGFANAVGMAIAEARLAADFNTPEHKIFDHYTYAISGDGCLMEGVSSEAASLAGHLGLGKLIVFYDSNRITIEGGTELAFTEDTAKRFEAYGWQVIEGDAQNIEQMNGMIAKAKADLKRPSLLIVSSVIGFGSPNKAGSHEVHGAPLGAEEIKATKINLGIPENEQFWIHPSVGPFIQERQKAWAGEQAAWQKTFDAWSKAHPDKKALFDQYFGDTAPQWSRVQEPQFQVGESLATRVAGGKTIQAINGAFTNLLGGSADLAPSNNTAMAGGSFTPLTPGGKTLHFGVREHAMGAIVNGIVLHGGLKSFGATFLVFADYMRPPIRLAAIMKIPSIFLFTHDSIFVGEDGPTHQPVEHYASLRAIPGLLVLRPGDAQETVEAWKMAFTLKDRPSAILLTRQNLAVYAKPATWKSDFAKGGFVALEPEGKLEVIIAATGSEVNLALSAAKLSKKKVRVVSLSSLELLRENHEHKKTLLPPGVPVVVAEAGILQGWEGLATGGFLGINRFGESGPGAAVAKHLGLTAEALAALADKN